VKFLGDKNNHKWRVSGYAHDRGQRYEVRYTDGIGKRMTYGYTDSLEEARKLVSKAKAILFSHSPKIIDRQKTKQAA
jgi:hypothetical protein